MWADTESRFSLSDTMRYVTGFSGGSRVSFAVAEMKGETIAGVIGVGAGMHSGAKPPREGLLMYLCCGETDPNKAELDPLYAKLKDEGYAVRYDNFPGGHVMPEVDLLEAAVRWMDGEAIERKIAKFDRGMEEVRALQTDGDVTGAWRALTDVLEESPDDLPGKLQKDAQKLLKTLQKDKAVKIEIKAQTEFDRLATWIDKNRKRITTSKSTRQQAFDKLTRIVEAFAGTRAAERAELLHQEITAEAPE